MVCLCCTQKLTAWDWIPLRMMMAVCTLRNRMQCRINRRNTVRHGCKSSLVSVYEYRSHCHRCFTICCNICWLAYLLNTFAKHWIILFGSWSVYTRFKLHIERKSLVLRHRNYSTHTHTHTEIGGWLDSFENHPKNFAKCLVYRFFNLNSFQLLNSINSIQNHSVCVSNQLMEFNL